MSDKKILKRNSLWEAGAKVRLHPDNLVDRVKITTANLSQTETTLSAISLKIPRRPLINNIYADVLIRQFGAPIIFYSVCRLGDNSHMFLRVDCHWMEPLSKYDLFTTINQSFPHELMRQRNIFDND